MATRVLRHVNTRQYFTGAGWTADAREAKTFDDAGQAVRACVECRLWDIELAVRMSPNGPDLFCAPVR